MADQSLAEIVKEARRIQREMNNLLELRDRVIVVALENGLSQRQVAAHLQVSPTTVNHVAQARQLSTYIEELGHTPPPLRTLISRLGNRSFTEVKAMIEGGEL